MTKLNQILAIEKGVRTRTERALGDLHKRTQQEGLYQGRIGTYRPYDEDGDKQPDKVQVVQQTADDALQEMRNILSRMFDVVATKDKTNTLTNATVTVDGKVLMKDMPVSFLIYMEKQLNDLETFVRKLPLLPGDKEWTYSQENGCFQTQPEFTYANRKEKTVVLLHAPTTEHPAQTQLVDVDKQIGEWKTVFQHGGLPSDRKTQILNRVIQLKEAVKFAREQANDVEVQDVKVAAGLFDFLLV